MQEHIAMTITGDELFKLPYRPKEVRCEENNIIIGHDNQWEIYSERAEDLLPAKPIGNIILSAEYALRRAFLKAPYKMGAIRYLIL